MTIRIHYVVPEVKHVYLMTMSLQGCVASDLHNISCSNAVVEMDDLSNTSKGSLLPV